MGNQGGNAGNRGGNVESTTEMEKNEMKLYKIQFFFFPEIEKKNGFRIVIKR